MAIALVTGASSGIGKETAKKLIEDGHTVYVAARNIDKMTDLRQLGATLIAMDVTKEDDIVRGVEEITAKHSGVDILVNNAGFGLYGAMEDTSMGDARYQFEVNFFGLARLTQEVLPYMRARGAGKLVNISSMGGKIYSPLGAWYHATKHALEGWSDCLRLELAPFGIDVIVIEPGVIETDFANVVVEPLLERSGKGAYADFANKVAASMRKAYAPGAGSSPSLIASVISKALKDRRPKTRYVAGKYAKQLIGLRCLLGDRALDKALLGSL